MRDEDSETPGNPLGTAPVGERPRERLLRSGAEPLSDRELIALVLGSGARGRSASRIARELLSDVGGLAGLSGMTAKRLRRPGIGPARVARLLASFELAARLARARLERGVELSSPAHVGSYLALRHCRRDQEVMGALYVDTRHRLIAEREHYVGTMHRAAVEPRAFLGAALELGASAFVAFHNHPSGDPTPSAEDFAFTRRLDAAAEIVGLRLLDHLIVAPGCWLSIRESRQER